MLQQINIKTPNSTVQNFFVQQQDAVFKGSDCIDSYFDALSAH